MRCWFKTLAYFVLSRSIIELPVHASTQMSIHNVAGAVMVQTVGLDRVVFARESNLATLKKAVDSGIEIKYSYMGRYAYRSAASAGASHGGRPER